MPEAVLEFKAKDGAWYAGTAEFEGPYLRVHFEHFPNEEDERWLPQRFKSPQDVKKMIRPASQPMQDHQCSGLRRGMFLCVACRRPDTECFEYYDAKLQQFHKSAHKRQLDGQECCMCEFEVEWLSGPFSQKRQFVSCGDICLRTPGDIEDDPVIKDYIAEVKSLRVSKNLNNIDTSEKNASLTSHKMTAVFPNDDKRQQVSGRDNNDQSMPQNGQKGLNMTLQCGESPNPMGDVNVACTDEQPLKKAHLNTPPREKNSDPYFSCKLLDLNGSAKVPVDVIQIDSDKEEEPGTVKDALPAKITEAFSHSKLNEDRKLIDEKMVNDDMKPQATSPIAKQPPQPPLVDEFSTHDFSGISKEHTFSCGGNVAACSCISLQRHHCINKPCDCGAVGFIPISPCHLTNMCSHSKCGHRRSKPSSRRARKSGHVCAFSATSQVCSKIDNSQACKTIHGQEGGDSKESIKDEDVKGLFHFLLVENLEKDILPSNALKAVHKVSSGAITVYIWPSLEYETMRRGYIFYQDSKAAEAAYLNFSAGKFIVVSSKGRPWVVSRVRRHKLDWIQPYNIRAAGVVKEENSGAGKEEVEDEDLLILHKGTEGFILALGKQTLFRAQQETLRLSYEKFSAEEKKLEALN